MTAPGRSSLKILGADVPGGKGYAPGSNFDRFGRRIDYMRISITDRCNLRCTYCMPAEGVVLQPREETLSFEEICRVAKAATDIGFVKFRVTGGEPLVVKDVLGFLHKLRAATGDALLALTTNGVRLESMAAELRAAGIRRLNISLDTLSRQRFAQMTRRDHLDAVLRGIDAALAVSFERVKINAVIVPGTNEDDLLDLVSLARERPLDVRFIEQMPLDGAPDRDFLGAEEMIRRIDRVYPLTAAVPEDPKAAAQLIYRSPALVGQLGFIAPRSQKFCTSCNRMRLTPSGELKGCLLSEGTLNLKRALRTGIDDEALRHMLLFAIGIKPEAYRDGRYGLDRSMSAIGG